MAKQISHHRGYHFMTSFNIQIDHGDKKITLTIIQEEDYYMILYSGSILGAIRKTGSDWILLQREQIIPGELPYFDHELIPTDPQLSLGIHEINLIAGEIENHLLKNNI